MKRHAQQSIHAQFTFPLIVALTMLITISCKKNHHGFIGQHATNSNGQDVSTSSGTKRDFIFVANEYAQGKNISVFSIRTRQNQSLPQQFNSNMNRSGYTYDVRREPQLDFLTGANVIDMVSDGKYLFALNRSGSVTISDISPLYASTSKNAIQKPTEFTELDLRFCKGPTTLSVSPDKRKIFVPCENSGFIRTIENNGLNSEVEKGSIDLILNDSIKLRPTHVTVNAQNKMIVACKKDRIIAEVDQTTGKFIAYQTPSMPQFAQYTPFSDSLLIGSQHDVSLHSAYGLKYSLGFDFNSITSLSHGLSSMSLSANGSTLAIASQFGQSVQILQSADNGLEQTFGFTFDLTDLPVSQETFNDHAPTFFDYRPTNVQLNSTGTLLAVSMADGNRVALMQIENGLPPKIIAQYNVGLHPNAIAFTR